MCLSQQSRWSRPVKFSEDPMTYQHGLLEFVTDVALDAVDGVDFDRRLLCVRSVRKAWVELYSVMARAAYMETDPEFPVDEVEESTRETEARNFTVEQAVWEFRAVVRQERERIRYMSDFYLAEELYWQWRLDPDNVHAVGRIIAEFQRRGHQPPRPSGMTSDYARGALRVWYEEPYTKI